MAPAFSIPRGVSIIAQIRLRSGAPCVAISSAARTTSPALSTFGSRIASGPAAQARARSSPPHSVSSPLIRISSLRPP